MLRRRGGVVMAAFLFTGTARSCMPFFFRAKRVWNGAGAAAATSLPTGQSLSKESVMKRRTIDFALTMYNTKHGYRTIDTNGK